MAQRKSHYDILGVRADASLDEIRAAFRSAASRNHPDRFPTYIQKLRATSTMQDISTAYSILRDPDQRRRYDHMRRAASTRANAGADAHGQHVGTADIQRRGDAQVAPTTWLDMLREPATLGLLAFWLCVTSIFAYIQWQAEDARTTAALFKWIAIAVVASPMLMIFAFALVVSPLGIVASVTASAFTSRSAGALGSRRSILLDFAVRLLGLVCLVVLGIGVWSPEMMLTDPVDK